MPLLLNLLFPKTCYSCGRIGKYFCPKCLNKLPTKSILPGSSLEGRLSLFKYHGFIKSAVLDLKYNFVTDLSTELVNLSFSRLKSDLPHLVSYWQKNNFSLIPIPLHPFRQNWRGFNQSGLLGLSLSKKLKLKYLPILQRTKNTLSQTSFKNKTQRKANVSSIFRLLSKNLPKNIILFDDVSTTGSTLLSASSVFPQDSRIWLLTFAG